VLAHSTRGRPADLEQFVHTRRNKCSPKFVTFGVLLTISTRPVLSTLARIAFQS